MDLLNDDLKVIVKEGKSIQFSTTEETETFNIGQMVEMKKDNLSLVGKIVSIYDEWFELSASDIFYGYVAIDINNIDEIYRFSY